LADKKIPTVVNAYKEIHLLYLSHGLHITTLAVEGEFPPMQGFIQALPNGPRVNLTSAGEHVPEAEGCIQAVKEHVH